jgi:hypothetical protein
MLIGNVVVEIVGGLFFLMRVYSRLVITKTWRKEDYILTAGWVRNVLLSQPFLIH